MEELRLEIEELEERIAPQSMTVGASPVGYDPTTRQFDAIGHSRTMPPTAGPGLGTAVNAA